MLDTYFLTANTLKQFLNAHNLTNQSTQFN